MTRTSFKEGWMVGFILLWILLSANLSPSWGAYREAPVVDGGSIHGKVRLFGEVPPSRIFHLIFSPNIKYCVRISDGKGNRLLKEFRVDKEGSFQNVIVSVVGIAEGKPFDYTPRIEIENCRIAPFVSPVRNDYPITLINRDPVTHDIQAYSVKNPEESYTFQIFNKPMPSGRVTRSKVRFRRDHFIFRTQCGIHDYMQSWGMAVGNPYFAVTGPDGRFVIDDLPPGSYDVIAWHPRMKVQSQRVTIPPKAGVDLIFEFDASSVELKEHDLQLSYRLETWLQPSHLVPPIVELQVP